MFRSRYSVSLCCSVYCLCVLYYCHWVSTQLQLSNIYHILFCSLKMKFHSPIAIRLWSCVILCFKGLRLNFRICGRCFVFLVHISKNSVRRRRDVERCAGRPHVSRQSSILQGSVGPYLSTQEDDTALPLKRRDLIARCAESYPRTTQKLPSTQLCYV